MAGTRSWWMAALCLSAGCGGGSETHDGGDGSSSSASQATATASTAADASVASTSTLSTSDAGGAAGSGGGGGSPTGGDPSATTTQATGSAGTGIGGNGGGTSCVAVSCGAFEVETVVPAEMAVLVAEVESELFGPGEDRVRVELREGNGFDGDSVGTFDLDETDLVTCSRCVTLETGSLQLIAASGHLEVDAGSVPTFGRLDANLRDVAFVEVDVDPETGTTTVVPGGACATLESATISIMQVPAGWACSPEWYGDGACDCGCSTLDIDCGGGGCSEPSCGEPACDYCFGEAGEIWCPGPFTGDPCTRDEDCNGGECYPSCSGPDCALGEAFPGGYCTGPCSVPGLGSPECPEDYCFEMGPGGGPNGDGGRWCTKVCDPEVPDSCRDPLDCLGGAIDVCIPPIPQVNGSPCRTSFDCRSGICLAEEDGWPEGTCTEDCSDGVCAFYGVCDFGSCLQNCDALIGPCREGYECVFVDLGEDDFYQVCYPQ